MWKSSMSLLWPDPKELGPVKVSSGEMSVAGGLDDCPPHFPDRQLGLGFLRRPDPANAQGAGAGPRTATSGLGVSLRGGGIQRSLGAAVAWEANLG